ncbi:HAMP domain-containing sensor histidine kinase [Sulfitobacter sp. D35]|uniref:sensor histidine kinase n=1 Tax=Sulfitobacter sp. D35 TaxID=3083252 RepID=UPI00296F906A|nr:HAMP domain-containing sensor histidine kinase [Sulfitobacter sp. D35]MDW4500372.1 HAMP domain-containing sensor histidine kinase [Sulfitobacter sp. D35]
MRTRLTTLLRSMPVRLALALVLLFTLVSLLSLAATYAYTQRSFEQSIREDLTRDLVGLRIAPNARAVAALVEAQSRGSDPSRFVLSYHSPNGRVYGNAAISRDDEGYRIVSLTGDAAEKLGGRYLTLSSRLYGGQLTIARSWAEVEALGQAYANILWISLLPTVLIALSGGLWLARRSKRDVDVIGATLDDLTTGNLAARVAVEGNWSDDLARIGGKVNQMAAAQEASTTMLRQVSSDIAHDLKTPIQRVAVHLDDLARDLPPDAPEAARVALARSEVDDIASVFQSLLQLAQVESGSPRAHFRPVDLADLCRTLVEVYEPSAAAGGQSLSCAVPEDGTIRINGDRGLLGQVLANLIENALRHTPKGTAITVSLSADGEIARLDVTDTGPGIPEDERTRVLQRLYRLDRSRKTPGNGLGLSLVEGVVKLHDGTIALQDNAPGLRVALRFPRLGADLSQT